MGLCAIHLISMERLDWVCVERNCSNIRVTCPICMVNDHLNHETKNFNECKRIEHYGKI